MFVLAQPIFTGELSGSSDNDRVYKGTNERVDQMSEEARAELARNLAGRHGETVPDAGLRRRPALTPPYAITHGSLEEAEIAEQVVRLQADLHRTGRRLYNIERSLTKSRYQMGDGGRPTGRYARLLRRQSRLERQLRSLR